MLTVSAMLPLSLPRFAPSAQSTNAQSGAPQSSAQGWGASGDAQSGDPLDFDLLAEYLLDDATAQAGMDSTGMPRFDFR